MTNDAGYHLTPKTSYIAFAKGADARIVAFFVCAAFLVTGGGCSTSVPADGLSRHNANVDSLLREIYSNDVSRQREAASALGKMVSDGADIVPRLLKLLDEAEDSNDQHQIRMAMKALAFLGAYDLAPILDYANRVDWKKKKDVIFILRTIGDNRAVPFFIECLKADYVDVRIHALLAISDIPDDRAFEPVLALLGDKHEDKEVQIHAIDCLCAIRDSRAIPSLRTMYAQKPTGDMQSMLIGAIGEFGLHEYVDQLIELDKALRNDDYLHETIAGALGKIGDVKALGILSEGLLNSKMPSSGRLRYAVALNRIPDTRKADAGYQVWKDPRKDITDSDADLRTYAALIVANSSKPNFLEAARWVLDHGSVPQKAEVVKILGGRLHWNKMAILRLLELAAKDSDEYVRSAAKYEISKFEYD